MFWGYKAVLSLEIGFFKSKEKELYYVPTKKIKL